MKSTQFTRNRIIYALIILIVIMLGLASRSYPELFPLFIATYAGDTLWALMVFLLIGFIFPQKSIVKVAIFALLFSFFIELSQFYHAPWIDNIREYRLGGLILGYRFLWSDLVCYSVGVAIGSVGEIIWLKLNG
ncbi:MAG: DUF2809 domain-containing protein [Gammaproteobacteria bacterium]|nr:MAG: DUF2809 domain-containing protein [Gammaproteobacteria bacterium]RKZ42026.1 MAG: DUF2809 domain-containing protein [Gammaproteobacteria bacterium]